MPFDPFGDYEQRGYLRNKFSEKDMSIVKKLEHDFFEANIGTTLKMLTEATSLDYETFKKTHENIFLDLYPWAGKDRLECCPEKTVKKGGIVFANPEDIEDIFNESLREAELGNLVGGIALSHPFLDGNGRTMALFISEHQRRNKKIIEWQKIPKKEYLVTLGEAINGNSVPLDKLLNKHVKKRLTKPNEKIIIDSFLYVNWSERRQNDDKKEQNGGLLKTIKNKIKGKFNP